MKNHSHTLAKDESWLFSLLLLLEFSLPLLCPSLAPLA
ncbi:hypothetical protein A2U01_0094320, partial [Trifolium medium]|nr:hypothetical protein [Trifolium medium]